LYDGASYQTVDERKVLYLDGISYAETPALPIQTISFSILCWVKILSLPIDDVNFYSSWLSPHQFRFAAKHGKLEGNLNNIFYFYGG